MQKNTAVILDIGSSKITVLAGERGVNNTFLIKGFAEKEYSGYDDGDFFDVSELQKAIQFAFNKVKETLDFSIKTVYVGVPGEFTSVVIKEHQIAYKKAKRISERDLEELFDSGFNIKSSKYTLINRSGVYFLLDDMRRVADPVGETTKVLRGRLSYIVCKNSFINKITPCLQSCGIQNVEYTSTALAEALFLFEPELRDRTALLVDVGYISTSFSVVEGDAIVYQNGFSFGGGYITAAFVQKYDIDVDVAEKLKRKVNLSLEVKNNEVYSIIDGDEEYSFPIKETNKLVLETLDTLCENLDACIRESGRNFPDYLPVSITGGGISFIRGANEHISSRLNMLVEVIAPKLAHMNKPIESSKISLLDLALLQKTQKESFIKKLFR